MLTKLAAVMAAETAITAFQRPSRFSPFRLECAVLALHFEQL